MWGKISHNKGTVVNYKSQAAGIGGIWQFVVMCGSEIQQKEGRTVYRDTLPGFF